MKYEPAWAKGREDMLQTSDLRWTDRQMNAQTNHYRSLAEQGPNKIITLCHM